MEVLKAKPFKAPQRDVEIKFLVNFYFNFLKYRDGKD